MSRFLAATLVLATVLAAGCGKEGDAPPPATTPAPSPTPTAPTVAPTPAPSPTPTPSPSAAARRAPVTWDVAIEGIDFVEGSITVQRGDTVRWTHRDGTTPHTVTADDGGFDSGTPSLVQAPGLDTFSFTFNADGGQPYHCEVHPGMTDTITVLETYAPVPPT